MNFSNPIRDILKTEMVSVHPDTLAEDVKGIFNEKKFHHLPVVDDYGKLEGIVSYVDLLRLQKLDKSRSPKAPPLQVKAIMTKHPKFLKPTDELMDAALLFLGNKFHALPIVEDEVVVGIITAHDLLALALDIPYALVSDDDLEFDSL